jgi:hypothetical protein
MATVGDGYSKVIKDAIIAAVEAAFIAGDATKADLVGLGDPEGDKVIYTSGLPEYDRGLTWLEDRKGIKGFFDYLMDALGIQFDRQHAAWATVNGNALVPTPVPPTFAGQDGFSGVSKSGTSLTLTLSPAMANAYYFVMGYVIGGAPMTGVTSQSASQFTMTFAAVDLQTIHVLALGRRAA